MKSFAPVALLGAALVAAAPLEEKRDIIWHTTYTEVTETAWTTTTKWVAPGSEVSAAAFVNPGGDFHETAVHYSPKKPENTPQGPPDFSFPAYQQPSEKPVAPAPEPTPSPQAPPPPPPAPTTPSSTYVAPAPTPESPYVAPAPPSSQAPPPPPPPPPTTTPVYVAPTPSTTSIYVAPTPTSVYTPPPAPAAPSPVAAAPKPQSEGSGSSSGGGATYTDAKLTFYSTGLGSCGISSNDSEMVVAVELGIMQKTDNGNPNNNPMCGKKISITANGKTRTATIVDSCPGCQGDAGLDLSPALFKEFAPESVGVITGASWKVLG